MINKFLARPFIILIRIYQRVLSPDKSLLFSRLLRGKVCHHTPHCSEYGIQVLQRYGLFPGIVYMIDRITSCTGGICITHDPSVYRVVFFSSAPIGVPFLEKIAHDKHYDLVGVVTNPDQPVGRGMKMKENVIKTAGKRLLSHTHTDIQTPPSLRTDSKKYAQQAQDFQHRLKSKNPHFIVVIAYGKLIPQNILNIPTIAPINVHGSLLPKYRGASPIQSVLLNDKPKTGITIMRMEATLDTGPMISRKSFPLNIHTTALDIIHKFQDIGPSLLTGTMREYGKGHLDHGVQDESSATYCPKLTKKDGLIHPRQDSLHHINNIYRGCYLRPKAHFILDSLRGTHSNKQIIIDTLTLDETLFDKHKNEPLISITENKHVLNPAIIELIIKPSGSKAITRTEFTKGYRDNVIHHSSM